MSKRLISLIVGVLLVAPVFAQSLSPASIVERDFRELIALLPGQYSNQEQVYFQNEIGQPEAERRDHEIVTVSRLDDPSDGVAAFAVSWRRAGDSDAVRHSAYLLSPSPEGKVIEHRLFPLDQPATDATELENAEAQCLTQWRREGGQFSGRGNCSGKSHWILADSTFWVGDPAPADEARSYVDYQRLNRAMTFECWAGVQRRDPDAGLDFRTGLIVHDQGGWIHLETDETPPQKVNLKLRNVVWPYNTGRPSRVLYAYREDLERAESYAWTGPDADRIAINLRWVQASCTRQEADQ
ncbi:MAG: hypothetical protein AB8B96_10590 [Lysobacterales bacterium]